MHKPKSGNILTTLPFGGGEPAPRSLARNMSRKRRVHPTERGLSGSNEWRAACFRITDPYTAEARLVASWWTLEWRPRCKHLSLAKFFRDESRPRHHSALHQQSTAPCVKKPHGTMVAAMASTSRATAPRRPRRHRKQLSVHPATGVLLCHPRYCSFDLDGHSHHVLRRGVGPMQRPPRAWRRSRNGHGRNGIAQEMAPPVGIRRERTRPRLRRFFSVKDIVVQRVLRIPAYMS